MTFLLNYLDSNLRHISAKNPMPKNDDLYVIHYLVIEKIY